MRIDLNGVLHFGQYRGKSVWEIKTSYLEWMLREVDDLARHERAMIQGAIIAQAEKDSDAGAKNNYSRAYNRPSSDPAPDTLLTGVNPKVIVEIVGAGRRALAAKHHPDLAHGDGERMAEINAAADYLLESARSLQGVTQ